MHCQGQEQSPEETLNLGDVSKALGSLPDPVRVSPGWPLSTAHYILPAHLTPTGATSRVTPPSPGLPPAGPTLLPSACLWAAGLGSEPSPRTGSRFLSLTKLTPDPRSQRAGAETLQCQLQLGLRNPRAPTEQLLRTLAGLTATSVKLNLSRPPQGPAGVSEGSGGALESSGWLVAALWALPGRVSPQGGSPQSQTPQSSQSPLPASWPAALGLWQPSSQGWGLPFSVETPWQVLGRL